MKAPRRLSTETTDPFERDLLRSWRATGPDPASRERAWSGLATGLEAAAATSAQASAGAHAGAGAAAGKVAAAPAAAAATATASATSVTAAPAVVAKGTWLAASVVKWLVVGGVASAAVVTSALSAKSPAPSTVTTPAGPSPVVAAPPAAPVAPTPRPATRGPNAPAVVAAPRAEARERPRPAASPAPPPPASPPADDHLIGKQVAALDAARDALATGDAARAITLLDDYDARFPEGALSQEATLLRVKALLAAGRRGDAAAVGKRFVDRHPSSPYGAQIGEALGDR
jgi:TolA-binding protein